ncbi:MAG: hypothetical protein ACYCX9_10080 [Candidatus Dormibacteria bacterium]
MPQTFTDEEQLVVEVPPEVASNKHPTIWYRTAANPNLLIAIDWNGQKTGELEVMAAGRAGASPSPEGARLLLWNARAASGATLLGRIAGGGWAGDARHVCSVRAADGNLEPPRWTPAGSFPGGSRARGWDRYTFQPVPAALFLEEVATGRLRKVAEVGMRPGPLPVGSGLHIVCCSVPHNVAIVSDAELPVPLTMIQRVDLSTGAVSKLPLEVDAPDTHIGEMVFSNDGALVAVRSLPRRSEAMPQQVSPFPRVAIYETGSGSLLRQVEATEVLGFSDRGRRLLTVSPAAGDPRLRVFSVIDWTSGEVLWTKQSSYGSWLTRPGSDDLLVADRGWRAIPAENRSQPVEDLWVIRGDGEAILAAKGASPLTD